MFIGNMKKVAIVAAKDHALTFSMNDQKMWDADFIRAVGKQKLDELQTLKIMHTDVTIRDSSQMCEISAFLSLNFFAKV